jgi:hypothetical protein
MKHGVAKKEHLKFMDIDTRMMRLLHTHLPLVDKSPPNEAFKIIFGRLPNSLLVAQHAHRSCKTGNKFVENSLPGGNRFLCDSDDNSGVNFNNAIKKEVAKT